MAERAVAHHADALAEAEREALLLLTAVEHVIAHLRDVDAAGAHALGQQGAGEVRDAHEAGAAGGRHLVERAHGLLDRRGRVAENLQRSMTVLGFVLPW